MEDLGIHQLHKISSESLKWPAGIALPRGGDAYWFLVIIIKDICKVQNYNKYTKCAKSAVKQKCLQLGIENVQRDVRWPKCSR